MGLKSLRMLPLVLVLIALAGPAAGQTIRSGSIGGTITDATGAALPGVTVTLTSPALLVPELARVSESDGSYQFADLPPGTYRLVYALSGFSTLIREEIRLTTGFAARVDGVLSLAAVAETVSVRGQSPLVDLTNTRGGTTVTKELLAATPNNADYRDLLLLVGGVQIVGPPLTGEIGLRPLAAQVAPKTYGQSTRTTNTIEGILVQPNETPDFASVDEVDVKTFGNTAETEDPGAAMQMIVKSGGNDFHGRYVVRGQHRRFQSSNIDDALRAQGISGGDAIRYYSEVNADLGGRIIRDTLWFYGGVRDSRNERSAPGYARDRGPDGRYGTFDDIVGALPGTSRNGTLKVSYQATSKHKFIGFVQRNPVVDEESSGGRFIPYESTERLTQAATQVKGEWQGLLSERLFVNTMYAESGYVARRTIQETSLGTPNRLDRETGFQTGASANAAMGYRRPWRRQLNGGVNFFPSRSLLGTHEVRAGYRVQWGTFDVNFPNQGPGNYFLVYDRVGGQSYQPVEISFRNYPVEGRSNQNLYAAYVSDSWKASRRLTLNLGLRWERNVNWVGEQVKEQGRFGNSGVYPRVDTGSFWGLAPRVGAALDLTGDGKTVLKGTYGWYNHEWPFDFGVGFSQAYNQNTVTTSVYRWRDQDGNSDYTPGEVNLDPNGPDFLSVSGATNNLVNPDLKLIHTHEVTGSIERELFGSVSVRGLYVYKKAVDQVATVNVLRPYEVWNREFTRRDPGPDGVFGNADDGGSITFFDFDPAYRGSRFVSNMRVNADRDDSWHNVEVSLNKRPGDRWFAFMSFLATKYHNWLVLVPQSPNDEFFPLNETWELSYRGAAGYEAPYRINLSAAYEMYNGIPGQRTYLMRAADPDRGPSLPSSGSIDLRVEPFGTQRGEVRQIVNLRVAREFRLPTGGLTLTMDAFNAFNSNVAWGSSTTGPGTGINYASGPTFGYVTRIVSPRALRFGASYEF